MNYIVEQKDYLSAIRGALMGIGIGLAVLVMGALFATRLAHPDLFLTVTAYTALVLGAVICGILQGRAGATLSGILLAAGIYALLPLTVSLAWGGLSGFLLRAAIYLGMGLIAGVTAWLIPASRPRRRYRYK